MANLDRSFVPTSCKSILPSTFSPRGHNDDGHLKLQLLKAGYSTDAKIILLGLSIDFQIYLMQAKHAFQPFSLSFLWGLCCTSTHPPTIGTKSSRSSCFSLTIYVHRDRSIDIERACSNAGTRQNQTGFYLL